MTTWFKAQGKITYGNPEGMRKRADGAWARVAVPNGIGMYYRHLLTRHVINPFKMDCTNMTMVHPPKIGTHITVLDGREHIPNQAAWGKYDGKIIEFEYSNQIEQHWKFFVLPVKCAQLSEIREELGVGNGKYPFHITIGRME